MGELVGRTVGDAFLILKKEVDRGLLVAKKRIYIHRNTLVSTNATKIAVD